MKKVLNNVKRILFKLVMMIIYFPAMWLMGVAIIGFSIRLNKLAIKSNTLAKKYLDFIGRSFGLV